MPIAGLPEAELLALVTSGLISVESFLSRLVTQVEKGGMVPYARFLNNELIHKVKRHQYYC